MYEIKFANEESKEAFKICAKEKMLRLGWKCSDLAERIGRPINSVYDFFAKGKTNRYLAAEIAAALEITQIDVKLQMGDIEPPTETEFLEWMKYIEAGTSTLTYEQFEEFEKACMIRVAEEGSDKTVVFYKALFQYLWGRRYKQKGGAIWQD